MFDLFELEGLDFDLDPVREHVFVTGDVDYLTGTLRLTLDALIEHLLRESDEDDDWPHLGRNILWMGNECYVQLWHPGMGRSLDDGWPIFPPAGFGELVNIHTCSRGPRVADRAHGNAENAVHSFIVFGTSTETVAFFKMVKLLCQLIAVDAKCRSVSINRFEFEDDEEDDEEAPSPFPLNLVALDRLVSQAGSARELTIADSFLLSPEEETFLLCKCHEDIRLVANFGNPGQWKYLPHALRTNQTPSKMKLENMGSATTARCTQLFNAITTNRSTTDLHLDFQGLDSSRMSSLMESVAENRGLQSVALNYRGEEQWQQFWAAMSQHATIRHVEFKADHSDTQTRMTRTRWIAESILNNTVLTHLTYDQNQVDVEIMERDVIPILELNDFRPSCAALHLILSDQARERLVLPTLERINDEPTVCFHFLREHSLIAMSGLLKRVARWRDEEKMRRFMTCWLAQGKSNKRRRINRK
jgi:hypothetical protein